MSLSQIELVWFRVRVEWECIWVNLREDNKVSESKMAVSQSNMAEFKMAAIINLSQNEWVKFFLCKWQENILASVSELKEKTKMAESKMAKFKMAEFKMACHHQVKWKWMSLSQIELVWVRVRVEWECFWVNLREDNKVSWIQDGSLSFQHDRIQDGCHHQFESEWMSEGFLCKWWEPILTSVSQFERKF